MTEQLPLSRPGGKGGGALDAGRGGRGELGRGGGLLDVGLGVLSGDAVAAECCLRSGGGRLAGSGGGERLLREVGGSDLDLDMPAEWPPEGRGGGCCCRLERGAGAPPTAPSSSSSSLSSSCSLLSLVCPTRLDAAGQNV